MSAYPPVADYALIGDCRAAALVSRGGSIDWCCMPRFDSGSSFGRLLDREKGGCFVVEPEGGSDATFREYVGDAMVLETRFRAGGREAKLTDCFVVPQDGLEDERRRIVRVLEGERGAMTFRVRVEPRFDYGGIAPWIRHHGNGVYSANLRATNPDGSTDTEPALTTFMVTR